jgi:hypothetical protein
VDAVSFSAGPGPGQSPDQGGLVPELADTVDLRRARLRVEGRMYELYDWACEYDFVNQINVNNAVFPTERDSGPNTAVTDLWLQVREVPLLGIIRVGNQKDPYGYEHLTSSRWLNFMERSFAQDAFEGPFNNGFLPGIQVLNNNEAGNVAWQVGEFKNTTNPFGFSNSSGGSMTVGRLVYLPVFEDEGRKLIHLGLSGRTMEPRRHYTAYDPVTGLPIGDPINAVRFRSRGSIRNGPPGPLNSIYADTGLLEGTWQNMIGLEFVPTPASTSTTTAPTATSPARPGRRTARRAPATTAAAGSTASARGWRSTSDSTSGEASDAIPGTCGRCGGHGTGRRRRHGVGGGGPARLVRLLHRLRPGAAVQGDVG